MPPFLLLNIDSNIYWFSDESQGCSLVQNNESKSQLLHNIYKKA